MGLNRIATKTNRFSRDFFLSFKRIVPSFSKARSNLFNSWQINHVPKKSPTKRSKHLFLKYVFKKQRFNLFNHGWATPTGFFLPIIIWQFWTFWTSSGQGGRCCYCRWKATRVSCQLILMSWLRQWNINIYNVFPIIAFDMQTIDRRCCWVDSLYRRMLTSLCKSWRNKQRKHHNEWR